MKADDFRSLTPEELDGRIEDMQRELFNMRMQLHSNQLSNTNKIKDTRRDLARAMTVRQEMRISQVGN
ncbi:50S ribosomal protein L29 [bacterium]|nr:50S ribosomal protein L29 [bacterium]